MEIAPSGVPYTYKTVVATSSRIDKGLLAIPVSLLDLFRGAIDHVYVLNETGEWVRRSFTAYDSSSKECRIGGLTAFYKRYGIQAGDELVLQSYGEGRYQILPESLFQQRIRALESTLDEAPNQEEAAAAISGIAAFTQAGLDDVAVSEFSRLVGHEAVRRKLRGRNNVRVREPYFELHHIDPFVGNHPKNVLVVCPNVNAQFTHAAVEHTIDKFGWLRGVKFNGDSYLVFQFVDRLPASHEKQVHSV